VVLKSLLQSSQKVFLSTQRLLRLLLLLLLLLLLACDCGVLVNLGVTAVLGSDCELGVLGEVSDSHEVKHQVQGRIQLPRVISFLSDALVITLTDICG